MRYSTPLRYPGGKSKLANFVKLVLIRNELAGGHYAEPYAGGAGLALHLLLGNYVQKIHINDLDGSVYAFWHSVLQETEGLCRLIQDTSVTMRSWNRQRAIQSNPKDHSLLELGFSTFFLNRANRSGIIGGGVIGGKAQNGEWSLDARFNKKALIARIRTVAERKDHISLYSRDAAQFIVEVIPNLPAESLIYFDPPYYLKGRGLYQNYYGHDDHVTIASLVTAQVDRRWIVSYDDTPEIRELYAGYKTLFYKLSYSAAERYRGSEVMFFSHGLVVPQVENPVKMTKPPTIPSQSSMLL